MSDNKKSILDFVTRSNQQFAARRKQQQQQQNENSTDNNNNNNALQTNDQASTNNNTSSSSTAARLTPAQQMQQRQAQRLVEQSSFYSSQNFIGGNNNNMMMSSASSNISSSSTSASAMRAEKAEKTKNLLESWADKIEAFVNDGSQTKMEMPTLLSGADRRELHMLASKFNLSHNSVGVGTQRRLVITKDALFFQGSASGVQQQQGSSNGNNNNNNNNSTKSIIEEQTKSKGQIRRERQEARANVDERELYADRNAIKAFRKYQDHVNPLARAVDLGEDEGGLDNEDQMLNSIGGNNNNNNQNDDDDDNNNNNQDQVPGTSSSSGHHEARRRPRNNTNTNNDDENDDNNNNEDSQQQQYEDSSSNTIASSSSVFIPEPEWMTAYQIEEACRVNEVSEDDISSWIKDFSEQCCGVDDPQNKRTERVVFCIDFSDFASSCSALARVKAVKKKKIAVVELTAKESSSANNNNNSDDVHQFECMKQQFDQLISFAMGLPSSTVNENEICLSLPGMPTFGDALKIAVAFPFGSEDEGSFVDGGLRSKYGRSNVTVV